MRAGPRIRSGRSRSRPRRSVARLPRSEAPAARLHAGFGRRAASGRVVPGRRRRQATCRRARCRAGPRRQRRQHLPHIRWDRSERRRPSTSNVSDAARMASDKPPRNLIVFVAPDGRSRTIRSLRSTPPPGGARLRELVYWFLVVWWEGASSPALRRREAGPSPPPRYGLLARYTASSRICWTRSASSPASRTSTSAQPSCSARTSRPAAATSRPASTRMASTS